MARHHRFAWFAVPLALVGGVQDASAATALVTRPVTVGEYRMRMVWGAAEIPSVTIAQRRGSSLQRHVWYVSHPFRLTARDDLSRGRVRARFAVGGYIDMRFTASEPASRGAVPLCGRQVRSDGSLVGTLRLPTGAGEFGTVVRHRFRATLARGTDIACSAAWAYKGQADPLAYDYPLLQTAPWPSCPSGRALELLHDERGTVQWFQRFRCNRFSHEVVARSARRRFWYTDDLEEARAVGIPPYFGGALRYSGTPNRLKGRLRGDFHVNLAVPRTVTIPPTPATLSLLAP